MSNSGVKKQNQFLNYSLKKDGDQYWFASWYAKILGYKSLRTFKPVIKRTKQMLALLEIESDSEIFVLKDGRDLGLSQFACFMLAIKADRRKPMVLNARDYFIQELEQLDIAFVDKEFLSRIIGRENIKKLQVDLTREATKAKVTDYSYFNNAGYLGMYRMSLRDLRKHKKIDSSANVADYATPSELAANQFRIALTTEMLKMLKDPDQLKAAEEHWRIGARIRSLIKQYTGNYPEEMPVEIELGLLKKRVRKVQLGLNQQRKLTN